MKKIITIILVCIALAGQAQWTEALISDALLQDTIALWIVPGCSKCITAIKMLDILTYLNANKISKDSTLWKYDDSSGQMWNRGMGGSYPYVGIGGLPGTALDVYGTTTTDELVMESPVLWMDAFRQRPFYFTDLLWTGAGTTDPWYLVAISTGTNIQSGIVEHPGTIYIKPSATTNSGYYLLTNAAAIAGITGGERTSCVVMPMVQDSVMLRYGFLDNSTSTAPANGVYMETVPDSIIKGKTATASSRSTTGTGYTLTKNTWYRFTIVVNAAGTRVDYYVYNMAGAQLWTDYLTTNIPPTQQVGNGFIATKETNGSATGLKPNFVAIDYIDVYLGNLTR